MSKLSLSARPLELPEKIISAYRRYTTKQPLDLVDSPPEQQEHWKIHYQYSLVRYNQLLAILLAADSLDNFVQVSSSDFDNLAPFLESLIEEKIVQINQDGTITPLVTLDVSALETYSEVSTIKPRQAFNQFPCDSTSRRKRHKFLEGRYPHATKVKVGIIGDDDCVAIELAQNHRFHTLVLEKDPRIVNLIRQHTNQQCQLLTIDVVEVTTESVEPNDRVQTFITDPPYTLDGALSFIKAGLCIMQDNSEQKEFYVVLNPTMMGKKMTALLRILSLAGISLTHVIENFSQYKLPTEFSERTRAQAFLAMHGISERALQYSSSSNLYVFTTTVGTAAHDLTQHIDITKLYEHYEA